MPESAEAQLKIAKIHYRQMGKPDRDYTHARGRGRISPVADAVSGQQTGQHRAAASAGGAGGAGRTPSPHPALLLLRGSLLASIARGKTLTDTYPLYSEADEALFLLGQAYEQEVDRARATSLSEAAKQHLAKDYMDKAAGPAAGS